MVDLPAKCTFNRSFGAAPHKWPLLTDNGLLHRTIATSASRPKEDVLGRER
jgi:hypothetical protein